MGYQDIKVGRKYRHLLFASKKQLKLLKKAHTWYVDGTFKIIREPFKQLFSIHVFVKEGDCMKQVSVAFVFMSRRSKKDYKAVFKALLDLVPTCEVKTMVADFEAASWNAIREVIPNIEVKGCLFHFTQAVYRKIGYVKLANEYSKEGETKKLCTQLMALPLLPEEHIVDAFHKITEFVVEANATPHNR